MGIDVADTLRFTRLLARGSERVWAHWFTPAETSQCRDDARPAVAAALRFAVKEAAYKAVGADFTGPVRWRDIEVLARGGAERWRLTLRGEVELAADRVGARILHVSTCEVSDRVIATVIATGVRGRADRGAAVPDLTEDDRLQQSGAVGSDERHHGRQIRRDTRGTS